MNILILNTVFFVLILLLASGVVKPEPDTSEEIESWS